MELWAQNLLAYTAQSLVLASGAALARRALRPWLLPTAVLLLWQGTLGLTLFLPFLQPWTPVLSEPAGIAETSLAISGAGADAAASRPDMFPLLLGVFAAGALARIAWIGVGLARLRRLRLDSEPMADPPEPVRQAIGHVQVRLNLRVAPALGPVSFGILSPVVILPRAAFEEDDRALYLITCHELLHIKRRDALQALVEEIAAALLWYLPWAWWVRAQIRLAREQVVDRCVASDRGTRDPYVRSLLLMAGHRVPVGFADAAVPRVRELRDRIDALYREVSMSRNRLMLAGAGAVLVVFALATLGAASFPLRTAPVQAPVPSGVDGRALPPAVAVPSPPPANAPSAVQEDDVVRVGGEVKPPRKTKHVNPVYPPEAREAGIQGVVILEAVIGRDGKVERAAVIRSIPELDQAALDAVLQWEFEPTTVNGKAVRVQMTVTINFTLN